MTRVLIADDSVLWCEGLAAVLGQGEASVVGKIGSVAALRLAIAETSPDIVLVGIPMPPVGRDAGMSVVESMRLQHPGVGVLVLSGHHDPALAAWLIGHRPGSTGYLPKQPTPHPVTLVRAVRVVASGGTFVDSAVIARLHSARCRSESLEHLSERERGILALMAEGRTNGAICDALCVSPKTVETHVRAIFHKLGLRAAPDDHRRVLAVLRYLQAGTRDPARQQDGPRKPQRIASVGDHTDALAAVAAR